MKSKVTTNMNGSPPYILKDGKYYVFIDAAQLGREVTNAKLTIALAREKIRNLRLKLVELDDESKEYDGVQEEINDHEMLISDTEDRFETLLHIPRGS